MAVAWLLAFEQALNLLEDRLAIAESIVGGRNHTDRFLGTCYTSYFIKPIRNLWAKQNNIKRVDDIAETPNTSCLNLKVIYVVCPCVISHLFHDDARGHPTRAN